MEKRQTVLLVHNYYQIPGGEDTVAANEKKLLEDRGHRVILYTRSNSELREMSGARKLGLPFTTVFNPGTYRQIRRILKTEQVDIVHVHNTLNLISPAVYYAAVGRGIPVVQTIHNFRLLCPGAAFFRDGQICEDCVRRGLSCALKHRCYRGSFLQTLACVISTWIHRKTGIYRKLNYICLTEFNKKKLLNLPGIREEQVFIKPNFTPDIPGEEEAAGEAGGYFLFAGRLDRLKGIDFLLSVWRRLEQRHGQKTPRLLVCGTGPEEDWCRDYLGQNRMNAVELRGFVPNGEVRQLLKGARALILPTRWYEGFPMTILEAYSAGTPVLGSDLGNVGSLIREGITGWRFPVDSEEALLRLVEEGNLDLRRQVRGWYRQNYTEQENYRRLTEIYRRASAGE